MTFPFSLSSILYVPKHPGILLKCYLSINYKILNKIKEEQIIFHSIDNLKYLTNSKKKKKCKKIVCNTNVTDAWLIKQMSKRTSDNEKSEKARQPVMLLKQNH